MLNKSGGILIAWNKKVVVVMDVRIDTFFVSLKCKSVEDGFDWMFFGIYEPNVPVIRQTPFMGGVGKCQSPVEPVMMSCRKFQCGAIPFGEESYVCLDFSNEMLL